MQNDYFTAVRRVIGQYGGVVEKYIGDAAMALFGAPVATENDALRCVRAALELQRVLPRQARIKVADLTFRVGIATGEALVDVSAARDGGQSIVAGDVVNTAARLQELAPGGGVFICENTHAATHTDIEYDEQPTSVLRGRSRPSRIWLAVAARRSRASQLDTELTPMVDREHERGLLINALHRTVRTQTPQLVTIFGAAGIGKSRLLRELARHAATITDPPICWRIGHCPPFGENVAYAALADIVKAEASILDSDDEQTARRRLHATLTELTAGDDVDRLAGALEPLVGLPGAGLSPAETEQSWRRFILAMAARQPTVLVFEDLHWADEPMLRFVEMLGASARGLPLLVICTARPELRERQPSWTSAITGTVSISLPPMSDADIGALYSLMFGAATVTPDTLVELADGNPLYAHEYVRMLLEGGMRRPASTPSTADLAAAPPMPDNVQAVIANRLDLLDPADRTILQAAAVVGRQFWPGAVAHAANRPVESAERALYRLEQRDLIQELPTSTMAGQTEYRFRHILVRDVCYQRLPRSERVARHQRTADWLEPVSDARQSDLAEVLAHHRWAAHEITRTLGMDTAPYAPAARDAMHRAARRAYALHALDAAAEWVHRAQGLNLPEDPALDLLAAELAFYRDGDAFLADNGIDLLERLAGRLIEAGDRAGAAHAWTLLGTAAWMRADRPATLAYLDRAVDLYASLPDSADKATALLELARARMVNFETEPAIVAADAAAELADRLGLIEVHASAMITLATARFLAGDQEGFEQLREATEHSRRHRLESRRRAVNNLAWAYMEEGDLAACNRLIDEQNSLDVAGGHGLTASFAEEAGRAYYAGNWADSIKATVAVMQRPTADWDLYVVVQSMWLRALRGEDVDDVAVDRAVATAKRGGFHRVLLATLAHATLCRVLQGRTEQAWELLESLEEDWAGTDMLAFAEWVIAIANAGVLLGTEGAARVRAILERSPRYTPWVLAALSMLDACQGEDPEPYLKAAERYTRIGDATDRVLALVHAARAMHAAGTLRRSDPILAEIAEFAGRNQAQRLLDGLPVRS
ncbi:guanylate cyclase [Rugosimonospora africana]|uniref:Guanylate cyclase n=2 Tax=Rugosimonospora africana TaxID=556532 RepID=A0A8J3QY67_9ACTN|nr:guanylate cyclase [Rugosimonospora africana]